ncbi:Pentachlorophenol 4-monooxygenase [Methylobacterium hispanicum]|jgi:2-polyprenyl-6-methoxyphenol hydroxylase-like FAD-dependent oxidoreductase|uniref:Pentachlorophenol 4-monooxygenase n=1 Tax=Methylobacterium hispanicum TaxID=270350 RepID=A0AAV5A159_9HYPH|nr:MULTISPECIES: FAD-dependent monooxygenase [Methylobacterium]GJD92715.1 Pentachlorophenol 4-monooxygenase [Methylobacterium hispanicum]
MNRADAKQGFDADVIVVGAGPIGLTTGNALRHHGVSCLLLEERTNVKAYSRANNLWARPQELLAGIGLRDLLAENSYAIHTINFFVNGTPTTPIPIADVASPYPEVLYSGQDVIERTLTDEFEARGGLLDRGCTVTGVEQDDDGVTVVLRRGKDGPEERRRCRYLVAADGAKSTIRPMLGLDFEPERLPNCMNRQVDAKLSWRRSQKPDQLWFFYYERGFAGILPVWGGYHRLFFLADDTGVPDRDPTLEEMQAVAREVTGDETLTLSDPQWLTHSRFQYGVSPGYARGRVFLAGDAGHLSLPIGGQGMNAGLHDAVEIAWRLAMTLRGEAAPVILDSYDGERGGEHARLSAQQARGFRWTVYRGRVTDTVLGLAAKALPNLGSLLQGTDDMQQMGVEYPKSSLNEDSLSGLATLLRPGPKPGERAPDAEVTHRGETTNLFRFLYNPDGHTTGWALLCFDGRSPDAGTSLLEAVRAVEAWPWIKPRFVLAGPMAGGGKIPVLSDMDGKAHGAYGLEARPALVLVRPDGHVAFRCEADRADRLVAYCRKAFGAEVERSPSVLAAAE